MTGKGKDRRVAWSGIPYEVIEKVLRPGSFLSTEEESFHRKGSETLEVCADSGKKLHVSCDPRYLSYQRSSPASTLLQQGKMKGDQTKGIFVTSSLLREGAKDLRNHPHESCLYRRPI